MPSCVFKALIFSLSFFSSMLSLFVVFLSLSLCVNFDCYCGTTYLLVKLFLDLNTWCALLATMEKNNIGGHNFDTPLKFHRIIQWIPMLKHFEVDACLSHTMYMCNVCSSMWSKIDFNCNSLVYSMFSNNSNKKKVIFGRHQFSLIDIGLKMLSKLI